MCGYYNIGLTINRVFNDHFPQQNALPTLYSNNLFALSKKVRIQHEGEEYRLRLTKNNRLILTN